jgi:hypothetical protein
MNKSTQLRNHLGRKRNIQNCKIEIVSVDLLDVEKA